MGCCFSCCSVMLGNAASKLIFIAIALVAAVVTASAKLSSLAALDVDLVWSEEFWRLYSCHLAHITWSQYLSDAPLFVILYERYGKSCGLAAAISLILLSALSVSLSVIFFGSYQVYAGLSGINCAAFSAILIIFIMAHPYRLTPWIIATAFSVYLSNGDKSIVSGINVASEAHIAGALTGLFFTLIHYQFYKHNL